MPVRAWDSAELGLYDLDLVFAGTEEDEAQQRGLHGAAAARAALSRSRARCATRGPPSRISIPRGPAAAGCAVWSAVEVHQRRTGGSGSCITRSGAIANTNPVSATKARKLDWNSITWGVSGRACGHTCMASGE